MNMVSNTGTIASALIHGRNSRWVELKVTDGATLSECGACDTNLKTQVLCPNKTMQDHRDKSCSITVDESSMLDRVVVHATRGLGRDLFIDFPPLESCSNDTLIRCASGESYLVCDNYTGEWTTTVCNGQHSEPTYDTRYCSHMLILRFGTYTQV